MFERAREGGNAVLVASIAGVHVCHPKQIARGAGFGGDDFESDRVTPFQPPADVRA
jgi:hypothetical protein